MNDEITIKHFLNFFSLVDNRDVNYTNPMKYTHDKFCIQSKLDETQYKQTLKPNLCLPWIHALAFLNPET